MGVWAPQKNSGEGSRISLGMWLGPIQEVFGSSRELLAQITGTEHQDISGGHWDQHRDSGLAQRRRQE